MKIVLINGSPKSKGSTSEALTDSLKDYLSSKADIIEIGLHSPTLPQGAIDQMRDADAWIFLYPLYVDGIPGHLLSCLIQLEHAHLVNTDLRIYGIVNCGFYEGVQAEYAIDVLQNWCEKTGFTWGAGVGVGGGGACVQITGSKQGQGPRAPIDHVLEDLAEKILQRQADEKRYVNIGFPRFVYKIGAQMGWRMEIKANGGKVKDLSKRLSD